MKKNTVLSTVLYAILEFATFCIIWTLVTPHVIDINKFTYCDIFKLANPNISLFLYGVALYIGSKVIYYSIREIIKRVKRKDKNDQTTYK